MNSKGHQLAGKCVLVAGPADPLTAEIARAWIEKGASLIIATEDDDAPWVAALGRDRERTLDIVSINWTRAKAVRELGEGLQQRGTSPHVVIFGSGAASTPMRLADCEFEGMNDAIVAQSWPFFASVVSLAEAIGTYPRYAIAVEARKDPRVEAGLKGAYTQVSRAVLDTFCRYMASHLRSRDTLVNVAQFWLGDPAADEPGRAHSAQIADGIADATGSTSAIAAAAQAVLAMCSGAFDAMSGQVLRFGQIPVPRPKQASQRPRSPA